MKTALAAGVLIVLSLTGCAVATDQRVDTARAAAGSPVTMSPAESSVREDVADEVAVSPTDVSPSGPITVSPETESPPADAEADAVYLAEVRIRLQGIGGATDAELVAAALYACEQFASGGSKETIESIAGSSGEEPKPGWNNLVIATWAAMIYCPAYVG